jgi:cell division protein FtsL
MKANIASKEKMTIVLIFNTILIFGAYSLYVYQKYITVNPEIINDFKFWGKAFLFLIPVTIIAQIIIHIIFAIINKIVTNEEISTMNDERDKLIELKAIRVSHWTFTLGFMLAMASQAMGMQPWVMFITLIASGLISALATEIAKLYFYRRGF